MLKFYARSESGDAILVSQMQPGMQWPAHLLWVDMENPTHEEEQCVEMQYGIDVPTRAETRKIEVLSRFYEQQNTLFMTATVVSQTDTEAPVSDAITFILCQDTLITCRYSTPKAFDSFSHYLQTHPIQYSRAERVLLGLLQSVTDRLASVLEGVGSALDQCSGQIFSGEPATSTMLETVMKKIGANGELLSRIQESLHSVERLIAFVDHAQETPWPKDTRNRMKAVIRDVSSLRNYCASLTQDVTFLVDAAVGLITIQQNQIIKIFSVAAVLFLPPTLVASMYGMNFHHMPELEWVMGYPMALGLMALAALMPYVYFKRKGWL